ncbi:hypothetical protein Y032_0206g1968 [Ancylostoma ceylanicum]|nr:hypothetical protein Y032_0206g1968 [Ancylostoma ceylanicum]
MDSLMLTLQENPDFFDPTALCLPPAPMTLSGCYEDEYGIPQQHLATMHYEPSPMVQTPLSSPDPPIGATPGQFEEFSLATQLPVLNGYNEAYVSSETATTMVTSAKFRSLEPYSVQYFFTTPPDTPPGVLPPMAPMSAPPNRCTAQANSSRNSDPTPTIRRLLQQKKKRMPAVPCHVNSVCTTCKTRTTSLWRRNHLGEIECNACNLYFRKNNCKRPATLRKDEIMKRKRKPRLDSSHSTDVRTSSAVEINQIYPEQKPLSFT